MEPLDATIEEEISVGGVKAFTRLYSCLLPYASDQRDDSGQVGEVCVCVSRSVC